MTLKEVWARLEEDHRSSSGMVRVQRRIMPGGHRDFFLALELPSRNRMLVLRTSSASITGQTSVPESRGLTVRMCNRDTVPPTGELELVLTDQQRRDIFDLLIEDLVAAAEQPEDERAGVGQFLARLADWQRLLMRLEPGPLSIENQQGLWGELWVLREVVGPAVGVGAAAQAWRGPFGADQDFQLPGAALEVKTSTARAFDRVAIASERQLEIACGTDLALIALSIDARPGNGETLPQIVDSIRALASDTGSSQIIDGRLLLYGYKYEDAESYADLGYTVRSRLQFRVQSDFPRVVPGDLRPGISDVRYALSLAACAQFQMNDTELRALLAEGL